MSDTAINNVISLDEYGSVRRNSGSEASTRALEEVRDLCCRRLTQNVKYMMTKSDDTLYGCAQMAESVVVQQLYLNAMHEVHSIREDIVKDFIERLIVQFNHGMPRLVRNKDVFNLPLEEHQSDNSEFNLRSMSEDLAVAKMIEKTRDACAQTLLSLDRRIGLLISDPDLELWQNPLSPESISEAFCISLKESIKQLKHGFEIRPVLINLFDQYVLGNMDAVYKELNLRLIKIGVQPELQPATRNPDITEQDVRDHFFPLAKQTELHPEETGPAGSTQVLQTPADYGVSAPPAPEAEQIAYTEQEPHTLPVAQPGMVDSSTSPAPSTSEDITLDAVAMLFDHLLEDRNIADSMRALIGRLQIPLLKVATLDRNFFSSKNHPARMLLNRISSSAIGWDEQSGDKDPLYRKLETIVQTIIDEFDDDVGLFSGLLEDLDVFLNKMENQVEINTQRTIKVAEGEERLEIARHTTMEEIGPRIENQHSLDFINEFVGTHWRNLLLLIFATQGKNSPEWAQALSTMDDLIWSVKPKTTVDDQQHLASMQVTLINNLREGMNRLTISPTEQDSFIAKLMHAHTCAFADSTPGETVIPEEKIQKAVITPPAPETAGTAPEPKTPGKPEYHSRPALKNGIDDTYTILVRQMKPGTWVEILGNDGKTRRAKLSWMSPITKTYLFTDQMGLNAGNYGIEELAQLLRSARARIVNPVS